MARGKIKFLKDESLLGEVERLLIDLYEKRGAVYTGAGNLLLRQFGAVNYTLESENNPRRIESGNLVKLTGKGYRDLCGLSSSQVVNPDANTFLFMGSQIVVDYNYGITKKDLAVVLLQLKTGKHLNLYYSLDNHLDYINGIKIKETGA